jgi:hypothetical protein
MRVPVRKKMHLRAYKISQARRPCGESVNRSANEGLPLNPRDAFYYQTTPDSFGFIGNPYGFGYRDLGMGTFLRSGFGSAPNPNRTWIPLAPSVDGQFQVATIRNVAMTPPQCSTTEAGTGKPYFQKEFFHNGYIKSLKQLVHFYNTRDTSFAYPVTSGHCPPGTIERVTCWPMKEVPNNLDTTTGMLGLTDKEEDQIVAFLEILTDGFTARGVMARQFGPRRAEKRAWPPKILARPKMCPEGVRAINNGLLQGRWVSTSKNAARYQSAPRVSVCVLRAARLVDLANRPPAWQRLR